MKFLIFPKCLCLLPDTATAANPIKFEGGAEQIGSKAKSTHWLLSQHPRLTVSLILDRSSRLYAPNDVHSVVCM